MKKFLLAAALVLALVTSLTAGTMAYYTATIPTIESDITTKKFSISTTSDKSFKEDLRIAPGDNVVYEIVVENDGEVPAETTLAAALTVPNDIPGVTVSVEPKVEGGVVATGTSASDSHTADIADLESQTYVVNVKWAAGVTGWSHDDTVKYMGQKIGLKINIGAVQIVKNETHDGN